MLSIKTEYPSKRRSLKELKGEKEMNSILVGLQWGDEGKGKVVQKLSRINDWIVRFSGGPNAGHTVYHDGKKMVHHLLPSGTNRNKLFVGRGTLVDLKILNDEIDEMSKIYDDVKKRFTISSWCRIITSIDRKLDLSFEKMKEDRSIGTTGRGIGPTVSNDANRIGIRLFDFFDETSFSKKIKYLANFAKPFIGMIDVEEEINSLLKEFRKIEDNVSEPFIAGNVLFEGTQGVLLDPMYGTYPYVTSTPTVPSFASYGSGIQADRAEKWGVFKAYVTRVGAGPFPTELSGEEGEIIRKRGDEFGATTGRPRRCGWIDLPLLKYASDLSNIDHLVMTKADVLNGLEKVGMCTSYGDTTLPYELENASVRLEYIKGWKKLDSREFDDFISAIEKYIGKKIEYVSFGPKEEEIKPR